MQNKSKEWYEEEINTLFKRYSEISGDDMYDPKKTLRCRLTSTAADYIFSGYFWIKNKEDYGVEINSTIKYCITSFNSSRGNNFLHYLNASLKKNLIKNSKRQQYFNKYKGLGISAKTITKIRKAVYQKKIFTQMGKADNYEEMLRWIGKDLGVEPKTVKEYLLTAIFFIGEDAVYQDGSFGNDAASEEYYDLNSPNPEEQYINTEFLKETLDVFNGVFVKTQERVKPYLRRLISAKYFETAIEARRLPEKYPFFDYEAIELWSREKKAPSQKDIAREYGKTEPDASKTIKNFTKKVRENLEK